MYQIENSIYIERPAEEIFDAITNPDKQHLWQNLTESAEWTSNGAPGVGSTMTVVAKFLGRRMEVGIEVTAWDPPYRLDWKSVNGPYPSEVTNRIQPQNGGAVLTSSSQAEFGGFFKLAEGLVARQLKKQLDTNYESLKLLLESGQI